MVKIVFISQSKRAGASMTMQNKYNVSEKNERTISGIVFDSKAELQRFAELKILEKQGVIYNLSLQPKFMLQQAFFDNTGKKRRALYYIADFMYTDKQGLCIVEDVKGYRTTDYKLKEKLFRYKYPAIIFKEICKY